jgi:hypothetical protein
MTMQEAQALNNPLVRCRDGRIGYIVRLRVNYVTHAGAQDEVGIQVRGERSIRWIPLQCLQRSNEGLCQEVAGA